MSQKTKTQAKDQFFFCLQKLFPDCSACKWASLVRRCSCQWNTFVELCGLLHHMHPWASAALVLPATHAAKVHPRPKVRQSHVLGVSCHLLSRAAEGCGAMCVVCAPEASSKLQHQSTHWIGNLEDPRHQSSSRTSRAPPACGASPRGVWRWPWPWLFFHRPSSSLVACELCSAA